MRANAQRDGGRARRRRIDRSKDRMGARRVRARHTAPNQTNNPRPTCSAAARAHAGRKPVRSINFARPNDYALRPRILAKLADTVGKKIKPSVDRSIAPRGVAFHWRSWGDSRVTTLPRPAVRPLIICWIDGSTASLCTVWLIHHVLYHFLGLFSLHYYTTGSNIPLRMPLLVPLVPRGTRT